MTWRTEDTRYLVAVLIAAAAVAYLVAGNFGLVPSPLTERLRPAAAAIGVPDVVQGVPVVDVAPVVQPEVTPEVAPVTQVTPAADPAPVVEPQAPEAPTQRTGLLPVTTPAPVAGLVETAGGVVGGLLGTVGGLLG